MHHTRSEAEGIVGVWVTGRRQHKNKRKATMVRMFTSWASNRSTLIVAAATVIAASLPAFSSGLDLSRLIERHYKRETSLGE